MFDCPSRAAIHAVVTKKGYQLFADGRPNLIGVRSAATTGDAFDDWITLSHVNAAGMWAFLAVPATTDPGVYWRQNPENVKGTAVVQLGQHVDLWGIGFHHGEYQALVQQSPVKVLRDANKDATIDTKGPKVVPDEGVFGINLHRANPARASTVVDKWSAGCQVVADPLHFDAILAICKRAAQTWPKFTYTLVQEADFAP